MPATIGQALKCRDCGGRLARSYYAGPAPERCRHCAAERKRRRLRDARRQRSRLQLRARDGETVKPFAVVYEARGLDGPTAYVLSGHEDAGDAMAALAAFRAARPERAWVEVWRSRRGRRKDTGMTATLVAG